jgi:hypothetical protein
VTFGSRWIILVEQSNEGLLVHVAFVSLSLSLDVAVGDSQWEVQALSAGIRAESITSIVCRRRFSSLGRGDYSYDAALYAFTKTFAFV